MKNMDAQQIDYLLKPGELINLVSPQMRVIAYEERLITRPTKAYVQSLVAEKIAKNLFATEFWRSFFHESCYAFSMVRCHHTICIRSASI